MRTNTPRVLNSDRNTSSSKRSTTPRTNTTSARNTTARRNTTGSSRSNARSTQSSRRDASANNRRRTKKRGGILSKILILLAVVAVLVGGFTALYFSNLFLITNVQVSGNEKLQSNYVIELAEVPADSTFLRIDKDSITARLLTEPWVKSVEVERVFPDTLTLKITEQPVAAVVTIVPETATASEQQWIISEDGVWVTQIDLENTSGASAQDSTDTTSTDTTSTDTTSTDTTSTDTSDSSDAAVTTVSTSEGALVNIEEFVEIPKIKDVSAAVRPVAGEQVVDEGVVNALTLLREFSPEMRAMVASISAPSASKTALTLYNNVGVGFGVAEDIKAKEQAIATLLAEHEGTITYINVHVANRATYRATE